MRTWIAKYGPWTAAAVVIAALFLAPFAKPWASPDSRTILQVAGNISPAGGRAAAEFDLSSLEDMGVSQVQTSTPWTEGQPVFEGVLMRDLLHAVGAEGTTITATALNDYRVDIPMSDFEDYPVILAYRMNGHRLEVRDKGPLWIIYPQDEFPELNTKKVQSRWVWQVKEITVR